MMLHPLRNLAIPLLMIAFAEGCGSQPASNGARGQANPQGNTLKVGAVNDQTPATAQVQSDHASESPIQPGVTKHSQPDPVAPSAPDLMHTSETGHGAASQPVAVVLPVDQAVQSADPRDTLPYLASDELTGRLPGTPGNEKAGAFIAAEFKRIGLQPLPGTEGYFENFGMNLSASVEADTSMSLDGQPLRLNTDFIPMSNSSDGTFGGPVAFVGYGITRPQKDYDDYQGIDVHGKVVLAMMKEPLDTKGKSRFATTRETWSKSAYFASKASAAAEHGAVALLLVSPPASGGADALRPFYADNTQPTSNIPVIQVTRRVAEMLLTLGKAKDLASIADAITATSKPQSFDLGTIKATGAAKIGHHSTPARNVMGVLPGTGPHADEWVVVGAHYDHLGKGEMGHQLAGEVGSIFHGADDNASGTTAVIELAQRMQRAGPLSRSVLFVCFTGEEEGLIGSMYFVGHPPIDLSKIAAMLNLDMVGRLKNGKVETGGVGTAPIFESMLNKAIEGTNLKLSTFDRGGFGPSDHMSFAEHKVPVLFLFTGLHRDYHTPTDTAEKINYAGIDTIVDVSERLVEAMSTMPRQTYDATHDNGAATFGMGVGVDSGPRASLGVIPDYSQGDVTGVPISGVMPDSAAAKAGLTGGDVLVGWNDKPLKNLQELSDFLTQSRPGDRVMVKVKRGENAVEVSAVLGERK